MVAESTGTRQGMYPHLYAFRERERVRRRVALELRVQIQFEDSQGQTEIVGAGHARGICTFGG